MQQKSTLAQAQSIIQAAWACSPREPFKPMALDVPGSSRPE
jgi:hypothetical protein